MISANMPFTEGCPDRVGVRGCEYIVCRRRQTVKIDKEIYFLEAKKAEKTEKTTEKSAETGGSGNTRVQG